jgi:hypothetical protein
MMRRATIDVRIMVAKDHLDEERLTRVFRALAAFDVDYAVFGAVALGLHGLARATGDLDLFLAATPSNIDNLKRALMSVFEDRSINEISSEDLCGDYPAVRYMPPDGFGFDILTRLGEAFDFSSLDTEVKTYDGVPVRVVTAKTLWKMKKDTVRPVDRLDASLLAERFGFGEG